MSVKKKKKRKIALLRPEGDEGGGDSSLVFRLRITFCV